MSHYQVTVNGKNKSVELLEKDGSMLRFIIDGEVYQVDVHAGAPRSNAQRNVTVTAPVLTQTVSTAKEGEVIAPMPGSISSVKVKVGDKVQAGDTLAVMEAMKMENNITATSSGIIEEVCITEGDQVDNGQVLFKLK